MLPGHVAFPSAILLTFIHKSAPRTATITFVSQDFWGNRLRYSSSGAEQGLHPRKQQRLYSSTSTERSLCARKSCHFSPRLCWVQFSAYDVPLRAREQLLKRGTWQHRFSMCDLWRGLAQKNCFSVVGLPVFGQILYVWKGIRVHVYIDWMPLNEGSWLYGSTTSPSPSGSTKMLGESFFFFLRQMKEAKRFSPNNFHHLT